MAKRTQIYLDEGQHEKLRILAAVRKGATLSSLTREAIDAFIARELGSEHLTERLDAVVRDIRASGPEAFDEHVDTMVTKRRRRK